MTDTKKSYTPPEPEKDPKLQANPHYWLYKVTREALDNENHPLHAMGHIWNRWACEGLSAEEMESLWKDNIEHHRGDYWVEDKCSVLSGSEKFEITKYIHNKEKNTECLIPSFISKSINFIGVVWNKNTNFMDFIFPQDVNFSNSAFMNYADFSYAKFKKNAYFGWIKVRNLALEQFNEDANFEYAIFNKKVNFNGARFIKNANFIGTTFEEKSNFSSITFNGEVSFILAEFKQVADFRYTKFIQNADFKETTFTGNADFKHTTFEKNVDYTIAKFRGNIDFSNAVFSGNHIRFNKCKFLKPTGDNPTFSFAHTIFATTVNFSESEFHHLPDLTGTDFRAGINLDKVIFLKSPPPLGEGLGGGHNVASGGENPPPNLPQRGRDNIDILGGLSPKDAAVTWHALSTEMEKAGYHDQALIYFGYELDAKRLNPDTDKFFKFILGVYKHVSDYGRSIFNPFKYWFLCAIIFLFIYCSCFAITSFFSQTPCNFLATEFLYSLKFAFKGLFPFVSDQTGFFDRMFEDYTALKSPVSANNTLELLIFPLLYGFHTLLSLIMIFLFGLGVRNRLRLR